jgi:hypothetical protein
MVRQLYKGFMRRTGFGHYATGTGRDSTVKPCLAMAHACRLALFLASAIALYVACDARATLIVVAYNATNIYVAADSRMGKSGKFIDKVCKIRQAGPWFMARAGWFETAPDGKPIQDRLLDADVTGRDLPGSLRTLEGKIAEEFTFLVRANKTLYPETYKAIVSGPDELADVLVFGFKDSKPFLELTFWKLRFDTNQRPYVTAEAELFPPPRSDGQLEFQAIGQNGAIRTAISHDPQFLARYRDDPLALLLECARLELESLPSTDPKQYVGAPIDILHITPGRAKWIKRKPECPEVVPYWKK